VNGDLEPTSTAVVTGAGGWLGRNLVCALADQGRERIRVMVQAPAEAALIELVDPAVDPLVGDVRDPGAVAELLDGAGDATVFHAAAIIHPRRHVRELFDVNVGGTDLVLDAARRAGARRLVHVSSNSPFGANPTPEHRFTEDSEPNPYLAYGASKLEAERLVQRAHQRGDVSTTIVRPPWFYGPHQPERQTRWLRTVRRGRFPLVGDGTNRRSMVFTGNLVHGLLRAEVAEAAPGRAWWIADPEAYAMTDVLATVRQAFELEGLPVSGGTPRLPRAAGEVAERLDRVLQGAGRYSQALHVLGELKDTIACDVTRAREELGYDPQTTLLEGMRESIRWCRAQGQAL
jgi:nucleoside-diphosphate-sugar epimerase